MTKKCHNLEPRIKDCVDMFGQSYWQIECRWYECKNKTEVRNYYINLVDEWNKIVEENNESRDTHEDN